MKKKILAIAAGILTLVALSGAASACWSFWYQPELPKSLRH
ncbi:MAG: cyclic lactone autoinducer peptide [Dethiobacter sp.]|nr:cyclic lactone autoinducer peptide [Dethiobacter sp.]